MALRNCCTPLPLVNTAVALYEALVDKNLSDPLAILKLIQSLVTM